MLCTAVGFIVKLLIAEDRIYNIVVFGLEFLLSIKDQIRKEIKFPLTQAALLDVNKSETKCQPG